MVQEAEQQEARERDARRRQRVRELAANVAQAACNADAAPMGLRRAHSTLRPTDGDEQSERASDVPPESSSPPKRLPRSRSMQPASFTSRNGTQAAGSKQDGRPQRSMSLMTSSRGAAERASAAQQSPYSQHRRPTGERTAFVAQTRENKRAACAAQALGGD